MKTYPEMNEKIKYLLRLWTEESSTVEHYAAKRIEELEQQNTYLQQQLTTAQDENVRLREILGKSNMLANKIVSSPPGTTIKGEIESMAYDLTYDILYLDR